MNTLLERLAEQLAVDAVEQARRANDPTLIDAVAKSLADTSTTFKETFLTCVRYIQAEERARALLPDLKPRPEGLHLPPPQQAEEPQPQPGRRKRRNLGRVLDDSEGVDDSEAEDAAEYAEVDYLDDEAPASATRSDYTAAKQPKTRILHDDVEAETPAVEPEITGPRKRGH